MSFVTANPWTVDEALKKDDLDKTFDNTIALKEGRSHISLSEGNTANYVYTNTGYTDLEYPVHIEIDGTNLGGNLVWQVHFMCKRVAGTGYVKLYNITDAGDVASSEKSFTNASADRIESSNITLASGVKEYKAMVKAAAATNLIQVWDIALVRS